MLENGGRDNHWGPRGMRERARKIGAELTLAGLAAVPKLN
jgi:signal transduction histidine kinase